MSPKGPYRLVTVNTAPERAKRLVGRVVEDLKEQYTIQHVANCESEYAGISTVLNRLGEKESLLTRTAIDEVEGKVKEFQPDVLVDTL
jgi:hypothetical protein